MRAAEVFRASARREAGISGHALRLLRGKVPKDQDLKGPPPAPPACGRGEECGDDGAPGPARPQPLPQAEGEIEDELEDGLERSAPRQDWQRLARAYRAKALPVPVPARPVRVAVSRDACVRCGVAGWKGCDHQLPYDGGNVLEYRTTRVPRPGNGIVRG